MQSIIKFPWPTQLFSIIQMIRDKCWSQGNNQIKTCSLRNHPWSKLGLLCEPKPSTWVDTFQLPCIKIMINGSYTENSHLASGSNFHIMYVLLYSYDTILESICSVVFRQNKHSAAEKLVLWQSLWSKRKNKKNHYLRRQLWQHKCEHQNRLTN